MPTTSIPSAVEPAHSKGRVRVWPGLAGFSRRSVGHPHFGIQTRGSRGQAIAGLRQGHLPAARAGPRGEGLAREWAPYPAFGGICRGYAEDGLVPELESEVVKPGRKLVRNPALHRIYPQELVWENGIYRSEREGSVGLLTREWASPLGTKALPCFKRLGRWRRVSFFPPEIDPSGHASNERAFEGPFPSRDPMSSQAQREAGHTTGCAETVLWLYRRLPHPAGSGRVSQRSPGRVAAGDVLRRSAGRGPITTRLEGYA